MPLETPLETMRVFIDHSSIEIFVNEGEETFTSHVYPENDEHHLCFGDGTSVKIFSLMPSVRDDFVI
jgi:beta-fructofuranosidase